MKFFVHFVVKTNFPILNNIISRRIMPKLLELLGDIINFRVTDFLKKLNISLMDCLKMKYLGNLHFFVLTF